MTFAVDKKAGRPESSTTISSDDVTANRDQESNVACGGDLMAERPEQGSNMAAFFNIVCVVAGTGTLGLPYSLAKGKLLFFRVYVLTLTLVLTLIVYNQGGDTYMIFGLHKSNYCSQRPSQSLDIPSLQW